MSRTGLHDPARSAGRELPIGLDARKRLLEFYRDRDRQDAERFTSGGQRTRGTVYAAGVARLESADDVYESYPVVRAAGVELPANVEAIIAALPQDWRHVCRIDAEGRLWTASLREKKASSY